METHNINKENYRNFKNKEIQYNNPVGVPGMFLIGFNEDNILKIIDMDGKNSSQVEEIIRNEKIREIAKGRIKTLFEKMFFIAFKILWERYNTRT